MLKFGRTLPEILKNLTLVLVGLYMLVGCNNKGSFHSVTPKSATHFTVIEEELTPTVPDEVQQDFYPTASSSGPKILNKSIQKEILVGHLKLERPKIKYDVNTGQLKVTGLARLNDEQGNKIQQTDFELFGEHVPTENTFYLKADKVTKVNSNESLVVRAKVTCLNQNKPDEFDCSRSVVDFFAIYKSQVYTEQMELTQPNQNPNSPKTKPPTPKPLPEPADVDTTVDTKPKSEVVIVPSPSPKPIPTPSPTAQPDSTPQTVVVVPQDSGTASEPEEGDVQQEGAEPAIEGRYQGHAETVDLAALFDDDEAIKDVIAKTNTPDATTGKPMAPVTPPKKDKPINKDYVQLSDGNVRPINQAVGQPDKGRLRNSTSILLKQQQLDKKAYFEVASPKNLKYYGTYEAAEMIARLGENHYARSARKLFVSNISKKNGGQVSPHLSHQNGTDIDFAYPTDLETVKFPTVVQMKNRQFNTSAIAIEKTYELLKFAFRQTDIKVDRIFSDKRIIKALCEFAKTKNEFNSKDKDLVKSMFENLDHVDGHGDHFHLRLKCSSYDPQCRQMLYRKNPGCT